MGDIIDLGLQGFLGKIFVVFSLITVVLFPSLSLCSSLNFLLPGRGSFTSIEILLGPIKDSHFVVIIRRRFALIGDPGV